MKKLFIFFLAACLTGTMLCVKAQTSAAGYDDEIMKIKGKWTKQAYLLGTADPAFIKKYKTIAFKKLDSMSALLKQTYPNPAGMEAVHYGHIGSWPLYDGGPGAYSVLSQYKSYYFNTNLNKILLAHETSTWIYMHINNFGSFLNKADVWIIDGQETQIFTSMEPEGQWKGLQLFKYQHRGADIKMGDYLKDRAVVISRDGEVPYIPITQKQYLFARKNQLEKWKQEFREGEMKKEKDFLKAIENAKNANLNEQVKEKLISSLQKQYKDYLENRDDAILRVNRSYDEKIMILDKYLSSHSDEEMQQAAVIPTGEFTGRFGPDGKKILSYPVRINPSYFKKNLPGYVPQFIVLYWRNEQTSPSNEFIRQFEEKFPIEKLKAMLDDAGDKEPQKELIVKKTDPANDPELKAIRKKAEKYADSMMRITTGVPAFANPMLALIKKPKPDTLLNYKIPARNEKWLGAIPKKLTPPELKTFISEIDKKFTALLQANGRRLPDASNLSALDASYSSSMFLLKGMSDQAAWLAIKALQKAPGNILVANNSGAVLNACGFQPVAVPVLESALEKSPGNSNIENNLGQAYMGLGDIPKATQYLNQSVKSNPYHPHANLSLAYIHYSRGDKGSALKYVENSLRGSFNDGAMHLLFKINPDARLIKYLKDRYKPPDYFNENKYHLPRQCEKVSEIAVLKGEYAGFRNMVEKVKKEFEAIAKEENELGAESMRKRATNYQNSDLMRTPFTELGTFMIWDRAYIRIHDENEKSGRAQHIYKKTIAELQTAYKAAIDKAEDCGTEIELSNRYMELMAFATREHQKYWMPFWREVFNDMAFWSSVADPDKHFQKANYAQTVVGFLGAVLGMAQTAFLDPRCTDTKEKTNEAEEYNMHDPHCPIDVSLDFAIGSFSLDCEKIEYHFGGLLAADVVHSFRNHRTTIAIGAGLDLKFGGERLKAGPIQGGFGVTGKMQYYLTFDGTHPSDQGFIWETGIKYSQKLKTGIEVETVFSDIKKIEEIKTTNVDLSAKTVLSLHNGWTFDGSLYEHLDKILEVKPEKQENKNIKIYNPQ